MGAKCWISGRRFETKVLEEAIRLTHPNQRNGDWYWKSQERLGYMHWIQSLYGYQVFVLRDVIWLGGTRGGDTTE